jgi:glycosyltransferase involved in cell wall biosynthesis
MRIAILTSGILPVPAVQGGAVENLIDFYLEYNQIHKHHDITVYSTYHHDVKKHSALLSDVNHYRYIKVNGIIAKIKKRFYKWTHKKGYYFYTIEYYIDQVIKSIRKEVYDIILIENRPGYVFKLTKLNNAKLVYHLHNAKIDNTTPKYKQIYDAADLIICVSDYVSKGIKNINPYDTKTTTLLNGIDLEAFNPQKEGIVKRKELGFKEDDFIIAYNGKMNPEKGIMELIKAMNKLKNYPSIKLLAMGSTFYGANTYNDHPYGYKLLKEAEPIKDKIVFTGFISYDQMPNYLQLADVAIIPSVWDEPFSLSVAEAQPR